MLENGHSWTIRWSFKLISMMKQHELFAINWYVLENWFGFPVTEQFIRLSLCNFDFIALGLDYAWKLKCNKSTCMFTCWKLLFLYKQNVTSIPMRLYLHGCSLKEKKELAQKSWQISMVKRRYAMNYNSFISLFFLIVCEIDCSKWVHMGSVFKSLLINLFSR